MSWNGQTTDLDDTSNPKFELVVGFQEYWTPVVQKHSPRGLSDVE
jgi:hypothetical protein